jgi:hypothetical protein
VPDLNAPGNGRRLLTHNPQFNRGSLQWWPGEKIRSTNRSSMNSGRSKLFFHTPRLRCTLHAEKQASDVMSAKNVIRSDNDIRVEVVTTGEQFMHVIAVRAICFMEETGFSAQQTIDGNDYQATHFIVYAKDEPIGTSRLRWFRDFAKIERTGFRAAYRNARVVKRSAEFVFDHVARKGYDLLVTHAEPKYLRLWEMLLGFKRVEGRPSVLTAGHEPYIEMIKRLTPPASAITLQTDPKVLFRIEGYWDKPGVFDTGNG